MVSRLLLDKDNVLRRPTILPISPAQHAKATMRYIPLLCFFRLGCLCGNVGLHSNRALYVFAAPNSAAIVRSPRLKRTVPATHPYRPQVHLPPLTLFPQFPLGLRQTRLNEQKTMFSSVKKYFSDRKRTILSATAFVGGTYLAGHYALRRLEEMREKLVEDKTAKEK